MGLAVPNQWYRATDEAVEKCRLDWFSELSEILLGESAPYMS